MDYSGLILGILGLVFGGGVTWLFTIRAMKRKANGEAFQTEVEAFKSAQVGYIQAIEDFKKINVETREDRDHFKEDRDLLRKENEEMRTKYKEMEDAMLQQKRDIARLERRIDGFTPFLCSVAGCTRRKKVVLEENDTDEST